MNRREITGLTCRLPVAAAMGLALLLAAAGPARADAIDTTKTAVGFDALVARLGAAAPTGAGIVVTQVEAGSPDFRPNPSHAQFAADTFIAQTGGGTTSSHATSVGQIFYGSRSMAAGVSTINVYSADNWLDVGALNSNAAVAPLPTIGRVVNNSWVVPRDGDPGNDAAENAAALDALRRLDYAIERDNAIVVNGVDNGFTSPVPLLMANAYNAISVGVSAPATSVGGSTLDVTGRGKPDLVAPGSFPGSSSQTASIATAWVSAASAMLLQTAGANAQAARAETIKATLLAGATKEEFDLTNSTPSTFDNWSRTQTRPLDLRYGAGELNIDHSQRILASGQQLAGSNHLAGSSGWDLSSVGATHQVHYFRVPQGATTGPLSIAATWNRHVDFQPGVGSDPATFTPSLANVDVRLYQAAVSADRTQYQTLGSPIDASLSTIDNVEHIYRQSLTPGLYAIDVVSSQPVDVALAWDARYAQPTSKISVTSLDSRQAINFSGPNQESVLAGPSSGLFTPLGAAYDASGRLHVADVLTSKVLRFDSAGVPTQVAGIGQGVVSPAGVAFDVPGNMFVSNYLTNTIIKIDPAGNSTTLADASDGLDGPFGLTTDSAGNVYVASLDNKQVLRITPAGVATVVASASQGLFTPLAVAVDGVGDLFVADALQSKVLRIDGLGNVSTFADVADGVVSPTSLAFDASGDLFVSSYLANQIMRLDPLGNASVYGDAGDGLQGPWGLAIAPLAASLVSSLEGGASALLAGRRFSRVPEPASWVLAVAALVAGLAARAVKARRRGSR